MPSLNPKFKNVNYVEPAYDGLPEKQTVKMVDEDGTEYHLAPREIDDVIEQCVERAFARKEVDIRSSNNRFVTSLEKGIRASLLQRVEDFEKYTADYLEDIIDKAAERIAMKMIDKEINRRIDEKVQEKLDKLKKEL